MTRAELRSRVEQCHTIVLEICAELKDLAEKEDSSEFSVEFGALAGCSLTLDMIVQTLQASEDPMNAVLEELVARGLLETVPDEDEQS